MNDGSALGQREPSLWFSSASGTAYTGPFPSSIPDRTGRITNFSLNVTSVTDENGAKLKYDSSTSGAYRDLKIYIPDAVKPRGR